jgi:hypothetical protein
LGQFNAGRQAGQAYDQNIQARQTIRETEQMNKHEGHLQVSGQKSYVYDPFEGTAKTTIREGTEGNSHQGQLHTSVAKGSLHNLQSAKTTIREMDENNSHGGHMNSSAVKKGSVYTGTAKTTIREGTENQSANTGHVSSNIKRGQSKITDDARVTHRQLSEANSHAGQVGQGIHKGQVYQGVAKATIRQDTEVQTHGGHVQNGVSRGQTYAQGPAKTTVREQTEKQSHQGQLGGETKARTRTNDEAKTTHRQQTEANSVLGAVGTSDNVRGNAFDAQDPNNSARTTIKETTEGSGDRKGAIGGSSKVALQVYDPTDYLAKTIREDTGYTDGYGIMGGSQKTRQKVYDPFDLAKKTIREGTEDQSYLAPVEAKFSERGGYISAPIDIKNVNRALLADYYYSGGAGPADAPANSMSQEYAYNMRQNINKEVISEGRLPTLSGVKLTLGKTGVNIQINKLDNDRLNQYSAVRAPTIPNHTPAANTCNLTSFKNNLPEWNPTLDPEILSAYNSNPLTHSLSSWA